MGDSLGRHRWRLAAHGLLAASVLAAASADAAIYRCSGKGQTTVYRDRPCASNEKQTRIGQDDLAGCFEVEDVTEWEGGSGRWILRVAADGGAYQLREYFDADNPGERPPNSTPLRRASLEEIDSVAQRYRMKVTGGYVMDTASGTGISGLFHTWNSSGELQLVGLFSFANGVARRVTCP